MESLAIERFFKVMAPDFLATLRLPTVISRKVAEANVEEAILMSSKGAWKVNICQNRDGLVCFQKGWDGFVKEHGLRMEDFAVFEHVGNMHFEVTMFGSSTCEKDFSSGAHKVETHLGPGDYEHIRSNKRGRPSKEFLSDWENFRQFRKTMTKRNINHPYPLMNLPLYFVRANHIDCNTSLSLRGPSGECVPMELKLNGNKSLLCLSSSGWCKFYTSNKIKQGDVCLFQLNQSPAGSNAMVMDVQVFPAPT